MKASEFCYWLQGAFEAGGLTELNEEQTQIVKNHLNLVFIHELDPAEEKDSEISASVLNEIHNNHPGKGPVYRC